MILTIPFRVCKALAAAFMHTFFGHLGLLIVLESLNVVIYECCGCCVIPLFHSELSRI